MGYKFRLYPNKEQTEKLEFALEMCRQTYNSMLQELTEQTIIDKAQIQATLPDMKICNPELKQIYSKALQYECYRLFSNLSALRALKGNHKKVGRLRFKGKEWFKTIHYNQSGFKLEKVRNKKGKLKLSKIGEINIKIHREVEGKIKQVTIKKSIGRWYAILITDAKIKRECGDKILGIDLGINNYFVDSEGCFVEHPKIIEKYSAKLKEEQQNLSRKKKKSKNRIKAKLRIAKLHEKIVNIRNNFLHKTSTRLIRKSKIIVIEYLNIKQMMQSFYNAKNVADASWGSFIQMLQYKAESADIEVVKVDSKNTTKTCSRCGSLQDMPLHKRAYKCKCGLEIDRDYNSAINILNKFLGSERACVENEPLHRGDVSSSMKQEATSFM